MTLEWCGSCGNEVELRDELVPQSCPECGEAVVPCNYCMDDVEDVSEERDCVNCELEKMA